MEKNQTQISRYSTNSTIYFSIEKNHEALTRLIFVEHLSFSLGEKIGFVDYFQEVLNPAA